MAIGSYLRHPVSIRKRFRRESFSIGTFLLNNLHGLGSFHYHDLQKSFLLFFWFSLQLMEPRHKNAFGALSGPYAGDDTKQEAVKEWNLRQEPSSWGD